MKKCLQWSLLYFSLFFLIMTFVWEITKFGRPWWSCQGDDFQFEFWLPFLSGACFFFFWVVVAILKAEKKN